MRRSRNGTDCSRPMTAHCGIRVLKSRRSSRSKSNDNRVFTRDTHVDVCAGTADAFSSFATPLPKRRVMTIVRHVPTGRSLCALVVAVAMAGFAAACGDTITTPASVSTITVSGSAPTVGGTSQLTATAAMSDGTTQDVTASATWQSANTGAATVSATGLVTGVASGTVVIQATYSSVTGSVSLTVP